MNGSPPSSASGRPRVLVVSPFAPSTVGAHGGSRAVAWNIQALSTWFEVGVVYRRAGSEPPPDLDGCAFVRGVAASNRPMILRRGAVALGLLRGRPSYVSGIGGQDLVDAVAATVAGWTPSVLQLEHVVVGGCATAVHRPSVAERPAVVLVNHDARESQTRALLARDASAWSRARHEARTWRRWERDVMQLADGVVTLTEEDRLSVLRTTPDAPVAVIPLRPQLANALSGAAADSTTVAFIGNYAHAPNREAARRLATEILPAVRRVVPGARLRLVGAGAPGIPAGDHVEVPGFAPDVGAALGDAAVVAVPIRMGGGVRVKVIEALALGKAVVASPLALEGLSVAPGRDVAVADTNEQFTAAIVELLTRVSRRQALEAAARRWSRSLAAPILTAAAYAAFYRRLGCRLDVG